MPVPRGHRYGEPELELLRNACESILDREDPRSGDGRQNLCSKTVSRLLDELSQRIKDSNDNIELNFLVAKQKLQPLVLLFDLASLEIWDIVYLGLKYFDKSEKLIWESEPLLEGPRPNVVFYTLGSNIAHTMTAFELLSYAGLTNQARAILRNLLELCDLFIAILHSEEVYRAYTTTSFPSDKEKYEHWRKRLSPSSIRNLLSRLEADDPIPLPITNSSVEARAGLYSWLSRSVHSDYLAQAVSSYPIITEFEAAPSGVFGRISGLTRSTLANALLYFWIFHLRMSRLLVDKHKWGERFYTSETFGKEPTMMQYWVHYSVIESLFREILPGFWISRSAVSLD